MRKWLTFLSWSLVAVILAAGGTGCTKQIRKSRRLARADKDFAAGRYDRAEIEYLSALQFPPPEPRAIMRLGEIYLAQGKYFQACYCLSRGAQLVPTDLTNRARFAEACLSIAPSFAPVSTLEKLKWSMRARAEALQVLDSDPGNLNALTTLTSLPATLADTNLLAETMKRLDAVPAPQKETAEYHLARARLHMKYGQRDRAEAELKKAIETDPRSSKAHKMLGDYYLVQTNLSAAEAEFKAASDLAEPRSSAPLVYAGFKLIAATNAANLNAARQILETVIARTPDYVPARLSLATLALAEQKVDEGSKLIDTILGRDPFNLEGLVLKGSLLLAKADPTNAIVQFEKIRSTYGKLPAVQYQLARAQIQVGDITKALNTLDDALIAPTDSLTTQTNSPNAQTNSPIKQIYLADCAELLLLKADVQMLRFGDPGSAIITLNQLFATNHLGHVLFAPKYVRLAFLRLAWAYELQRNTMQAVAVCRRMATVFTNDPAPYMAIGSLALSQQNANEARKAFEAALQIAPTNAPENLEAEERLVGLELSTKNFINATDRVKKRIDRRPHEAEAWLLSATVHWAQAKAHTGLTNSHEVANFMKTRLNERPAAQAEVDQAEKDALKAIEMKPEQTAGPMLLAQIYSDTGRQQQALERLSLLAQTNNAQALFQIGLIHTELRNYTAARDAYEKLLKNVPPSNSTVGKTMNNLAFLYSDYLGDLARALELAQKARDRLPYAPETADTLAWVRFRQGDYALAAAMLDECATTRIWGDPEVQYHVGMAHYMLGEEETARVALERALQSTQDFPGKDEAGKRLAVLNTGANITDPSKIAELRQSLGAQGDDPVIMARIAALQEQNGQYAEARDSYELLLKKQPRNSRLRLRLIRLYVEHLNGSARAFELAKQAHDIAPENSEIAAILGRLAFQKGDHQWALDLLQQAARKLPDNAELTYDLAWANYSVGKVNDAVTTMKAVIEKLPADRGAEAKLFVRLAGALTDPAQLLACAAEGETVLQKRSDYVPALMVAALSQERDRKFDAARATYEKVLTIYPSFGPAQFYIGMSQYRLKQYPQSKETLQRALRMNLDPNLADQAKKALQEMNTSK